MRHLTVIDPAMTKPELDCFNRIAKGSTLPVTYHLAAMQGLASLAGEEDVAGIIVFGSASSVNDDFPWQRALGEWLRVKLGQGVPILGICFGHQLIAHLLGGRVGFLYPDHHKLVGFEDASIATNPLCDASTGPLYYSHREVVQECPAELAVVATRPEHPYDALAHVSLPVWTFQAHPEATPGFGAGIDAPAARFSFGNAIVDRFCEIVRSLAPAARRPQKT